MTTVAETRPDLAAAVASYGLAGTAHDLPTAALSTADWDHLLADTRRQRLTGLLLTACQDGALAVTAEQLDQVADAHTTAMTAALHLEAELLQIHDCLLGAGVDVRVLKGTAVAHLDYADPALRCFGDNDLLVRGDHFDLAVRTLVGAGLERRFPEPRPGFDRRFSKGTSFTRDGLELDLHRTFVMGPYGLRLQPDDLWRGSAGFVVGGRPMEALDADCRFLHACFHAALGEKVPRLVPLRDVAQMLLHGDLDVVRVRHLMETWGAKPVVATAVRAAWARLRLADVVALSAWAQRYPVDERSRRELAVYSDPEGSYAGKSLAAVRALPRWRDRVAFVRALALPDSAYLEGRTRGVARLRTGLAARRSGS